MKRGVVVLALLCALLAQPASSSPTRAPSPAEATAAFGRLLHQRYGDFRGYWTCPAPAVSGHIDCLGEVHAAKRWHQAAARARLVGSRIVFSLLSADTWTRHWWPYSRHFLEPSVPGVVSVNGPAYDWAWLAAGARELKAGQTRRVDALDGDATGLHRFFFFTCSRQGALTTCRNALGDAMRYRP